MKQNKRSKHLDRYTFSDADNHKIVIYSQDVVFVQNEEALEYSARGEDNTEQLWLGTVLGFRKDELGTLCKIQWYYNFEQAKEFLGRPKGMGQDWVKKYGAGPREVFHSNHVDVIDPLSILDVAVVHRYIPTDPDQPLFSTESWYTRGSISIGEGGTSSRLTPMTFHPLSTAHRQQSCCQRTYNPQKDQQIYCRKCKIYYHVDELEHHLSQSLDNPLTRIIRGFGWETDVEDPIGWSQVGNFAVDLDGETPSVITSNLSQEEKDDLYGQVREVLQSIRGNMNTLIPTLSS
ncbi:hypothetical protein EV360DRAFT_90739 [Lentinula raphanica]|nr:hypothetical protein EV360DRAFT_90739 [Lentinula raphanica]